MSAMRTPSKPSRAINSTAACRMPSRAPPHGVRGCVVGLGRVLLGPGLAIGVTDLILRRNRYRGPGLCNETPTSAYWYHGGVNQAGVTAQVLGTAAALLCINSTDFQGPSPPRSAELTCPRWSAPPSEHCCTRCCSRACTAPNSPRPAPNRSPQTTGALPGATA